MLERQFWLKPFRQVGSPRQCGLDQELTEGAIHQPGICHQVSKHPLQKPCSPDSEMYLERLKGSMGWEPGIHLVS